MGNVLVDALKAHQSEVELAVKAAPDWSIATQHWDSFFAQMANPKDGLWSETTMDILRPTYYKARDEDKECANITDRTVKAMPPESANDTKKIFLQIANVCRIFHASHKVNFDASEIPSAFSEIPMIAGKSKGTFTYAQPMPSLYAKISLTFDYWVPKILDWSQELRAKGLGEWKGNASFQHESCTDFMRVAMQFLSDPTQAIPICKTDTRMALLERVFGKEFVWVKKSAKREDIAANSSALIQQLKDAEKQAGLSIPLEAWNRVLELKPIKSLLA